MDLRVDVPRVATLTSKTNSISLKPRKIIDVLGNIAKMYTVGSSVFPGHLAY